jgi:hypothetical protein
VGCSALSSQSVSDLARSGTGPEGTFYALPKGVVPFRLQVHPKHAVFEVVAYPVTYVADDAHKYFLQYLPRADATDHVTVSVNKQSFLKSITANVTDETGNIILSIFRGNKQKSGTTLQGAFVTDDPTEVLDNITIDPVDRDERDALRARFGYAIMSFVGRMKRKCASYADAAQTTTSDLPPLQKELADLKAKEAKATDPNEKAQLKKDIAAKAGEIATVEAELKALDGVWKGGTCKEYDRLYEEYGGDLLHKGKDQWAPPRDINLADVPAQWRGIVSLMLHKPPVIYVAPDKPVDCRVGACYRPARTYALEVSIAGGGSALVPIVLPNGGPLVALDITRAFLVNKVTDLTFDPETGLLTQFKIDKKSELLAASKLPIDVVTAVLEVPAEIMQLQIKYSEQQEALAEAEANLARAQGAADAAKLPFPSSILQGDKQEEPMLLVSTFPTFSPKAEEAN